MIPVFLSIQSKKNEVIAFIRELNTIIDREDFDINTNFTLIKKSKLDDNEHSTNYTIVDLEYDIYDVVDRIRELTISEYSETKIDYDDLNPPLLFVFGKIINNKLVYIKLKIKENQNKYILCVSFHYAKDEMNFPYA